MTIRYCACGARLARDNPGDQCSPCQAAARHRASAVPADRTRDDWIAQCRNQQLAVLIHEAGFSEAGLARRVNELAGPQTLGYDYTATYRWLRLGQIPRGEAPHLIAQALSERLGRPVSLADIGMAAAGTPIAPATEPATFASLMHALRVSKGWSFRRLAQTVHYSHGYLWDLETGGKTATENVAAALDQALGANGRLVAVAKTARAELAQASTSVKRRSFLTVGTAALAESLAAPSRMTQALDIVTAQDVDSLGVATDSLDDLVAHYSDRLATSPPGGIYQDLLTVRAYAGTLLCHKRPLTKRADLLVAAGWLSNLLAVATSYMGDHGAAIVWCGDAERRSRDAGLPELAGWASLTRATIAYYQGQANRSASLSAQGQTLVPMDTVAHAKLAAQEMRARAMLGDTDGMLRAKQHAATAIARIPGNTATGGVFSIAMSKEDPPYTATSLLLVNRYQEAATVARGVIDTAYSSMTHDRSEPSSNYARALLILGLAEAGLGHLSEAVAAGRDALDSVEAVWPTLVLAGRLDRVLMHAFANSPQALEFHDLYLDTRNTH